MRPMHSIPTRTFSCEPTRAAPAMNFSSFSTTQKQKGREPFGVRGLFREIDTAPYIDFPPAPDAIAHGHIASGTRRTAGRTRRMKVMRRFSTPGVDCVKAFFPDCCPDAKRPFAGSALVHKCCG
jgi:hypothetical protein